MAAPCDFHVPPIVCRPQYINNVSPHTFHLLNHHIKCSSAYLYFHVKMSAFSSFSSGFLLPKFHESALSSFSSYTVSTNFSLDDGHCMPLEGNKLGSRVLVGDEPMEDNIQAASRPSNDTIKSLIDYCL